LVLVIGFTEYRHLQTQQGEILADGKRKATLIAEIIKNGITTMMVDERHEDLQGFLETLVSSEMGAVRILRLDGTVIGSSEASEIGSVREVGETDSIEIGDPPLHSIQLPIYNEKPCLSCHWGEPDVIAMLSVDLPAGKTLERLQDTENKAILTFIIALLVLSVLLSLITTHLVTKPVKGIIDTMKKVREGDLKVRFLTSRTDEIGALAESLNSMLFELNRTRNELMRCHQSDIQKVEKMATVGELAAAIAHDIKNPLAGISGAIQVFAEDFPAEDPRKEIIEDVLREIERLDRSVKDLLSYARPPEPNFIKTSIAPIIDRVVRLMWGQARHQEIDIEVKHAEHPREIHVDPEQMQQVFLNIMLNAFHSMEQGGTLKVNTVFDSQTGMAEVAFNDTGPGIPEHNLKDIFKPFFTTKHAGTGLGLAISKNTVEKHGGTILVESKVGVGSTFRVLLPLEIKHG
jgi:signal transduction histidine kinase